MAVFYQKSSLEPQVSINLNFPPTKWCLENMIWQRQTLVRRRFSCVWKHNLFLTSKKVFWKLSLLKRFKKVVCSQQLSNMCCKSWPLLTCHFVNVALPILAHHPLRFPSLRRLCYQPKPSGFPGIKIKDFWRENSNCRIPNEIRLFVSLFDAKIQIHFIIFFFKWIIISCFTHSLLAGNFKMKVIWRIHYLVIWSLLFDLFESTLDSDKTERICDTVDQEKCIGWGNGKPEKSITSFSNQFDDTRSFL